MATATEAVENGSTKLMPELDVDFDELDDKEFDIPRVDQTPTLESILNAPDEDIPMPDNCIVDSASLQNDSGETGSLGSQETVLSGSDASMPSRRPLQKGLRYALHGSVLRHVILKMASAQLVSAADRVDAGLPTSIAAASVVVVGTSHGVVLMFDARQTLRWCLGGAGGVGTEFGAVSALALNDDCTRVLVGYARGQLTMWDLTSGKLLRTVADAHSPGVAVLSVKFTDDKTVALMSDSGGSVFRLEFKRIIGLRTCDSQCLFSGSRGEVCVIEPLCFANSPISNSLAHPARDLLMLAMASLSKVILVALHPELRVVSVHMLCGDPTTLPLLAWHFVIVHQTDRQPAADPVLAFARDQTVYFVQIKCSESNGVKVIPLQKTELPYKLLSMSWLNSRTMTLIDVTERAHVLDVRSEDDVEMIDLSDVRLVYGSSFYKSLATGGNVSPALACAGERACYQAVVAAGGQLILLGMKGIHVLVLRTWSERLDLMVRRDRYQDALSLARSFYEGSARAVIGLTGNVERRKEVVAERIMELLSRYVTLSMTKLCPSHGKLEELETYYQTVVTACVDHCLLVGRTDFLFGQLYEHFSADSIAKATYLECLEPYMLDDTLTSVTPTVMKDFVDHYEKCGALTAVEACVTHMDVASLDIHQVVSLCWAHGLYNGILYVYNRAMKDYATPLEELLALLAVAVATGKQLTYEQVQLGNKILVYISSCLVGHAYPSGRIADDDAGAVKQAVLDCVTALHTARPADTEPAYPHLRTLLRFDTRALFNVLSLAFDNDLDMTAEKKQRIVDILLLLMVDGVGFSPAQVGVLFTFLARQMARHGDDIFVNRALFDQVLESLCLASSSSGSKPSEVDLEHEERQQALLELCAAGGLEHFDEDRLVKLATSAAFYRVCELVYERRREFDKIVACYWRDPARAHMTFIYVQTVAGTADCDRLRAAVLEAVEELVRIDARRTAKLMLLTLDVSAEQVMERLDVDGREAAVFDFLSGVFDFVGSTTPELIVEPSVYERFVEMMCRLRRPKVVDFLRATSGYRLAETLEVCRRHGMSDAVVYLLEKSGEIRGAFDVAFEVVTRTVGEVVETGSDADCCELSDVVCGVIGLLQRGSRQMEQSEAETVWFSLLDFLLDAVKLVKTKSPSVAAAATDVMKSATKQVINAMMSHVSLPAVLQRIVTDDGGVAAHFGDVRDLLTGVLDACSYEETLLSTCSRLVHHDLHATMQSMTLAANRATALRGELCVACGRAVVGPAVAMSRHSDDIVCFHCGHVFHRPCLLDALAASPTSPDSGRRWKCPVCSRDAKNVLADKRHGRSPTTSSPSHSKPRSSDRLEPVQISTIDRLRAASKSPSRLTILAELAQSEHSRGSSTAGNVHTKGILHGDHFALQLAPPPPPSD